MSELERDLSQDVQFISIVTPLVERVVSLTALSREEQQKGLDDFKVELTRIQEGGKLIKPQEKIVFYQLVETGVLDSLTRSERLLPNFLRVGGRKDEQIRTPLEHIARLMGYPETG